MSTGPHHPFLYCYCYWPTMWIRKPMVEAGGRLLTEMVAGAPFLLSTNPPSPLRAVPHLGVGITGRINDKIGKFNLRENLSGILKFSLTL